MRTEAANCLLKTLEEPPSRSILILVTAKPYSLLGTIRSRSRMLQFGAIAENTISEYLVQHGHVPEDARLAAVLSNGSLGAALGFDATRGREIRQQALRFVSLLLRRERFTHASALAATLAKDKDSFQPWVEMVSTLLQDVYYAQMAPERMTQRDLAGDLNALAQKASHSAVVSAIAAVKNLKSALQRNVNRQIALEALFLAATEGG
jgi:DNA polymerase-3 subunit delta'